VGSYCVSLKYHFFFFTFHWIKIICLILYLICIFSVCFIFPQVYGIEVSKEELSVKYLEHGFFSMLKRAIFFHQCSVSFILKKNKFTAHELLWPNTTFSCSFLLNGLYIIKYLFFYLRPAKLKRTIQS